MLIDFTESQIQFIKRLIADKKEHIRQVMVGFSYISPQDEIELWEIEKIENKLSKKENKMTPSNIGIYITEPSHSVKRIRKLKNKILHSVNTISPRKAVLELEKSAWLVKITNHTIKTYLLFCSDVDVLVRDYEIVLINVINKNIPKMTEIDVDTKITEYEHRFKQEITPWDRQKVKTIIEKIHVIK